MSFLSQLASCTAWALDVDTGVSRHCTVQWSHNLRQLNQVLKLLDAIDV